jgi:CO dehydrogenase maturation factor
MRVAFVGKGGAGKSAIAGTFARLVARRGGPVLAVDSDPMPGLAFSLGVPVTDAPIPDEAVEEKPEGEEGPRFRLRAGLDAETAVQRYAVRGPDDVRFLQFAKLRGTEGHMRAQFAFRAILAGLPDNGWHVVGDLPGGTRQPMFGWGRYAQTVLVVVEPTAKSLLAGRRLARLALSEQPPERIVAVANKVREPADVDRVRDRTGLDVVAAVPEDDAIAQADRAGVAPLDHAPDSPAVQAVASLVEQLAEQDDP